MKHKLVYAMIGTVFMFNICGCYYDVDEELNPATGTTQCDTTNVTYNTKVLTIIRNNCYSCHSGSSPLGNVNLEGYANLKSYADNGKLMSVLKHTSGFSPMPKGGNKLNDCDISSIQTWINNGAVNN